MEFKVGTKVEHDRYGKGMVSKVGLTTISVLLERGGEMQFSQSSDEITVLEQPDGVENQSASVSGPSVAQIEEVISFVLDKYGLLPETIDLADKWTGGKMVLEPGQTGMQNKEIPIETFFHKIVMLRDRLRVLEQNINSNPKLDDADKVNMQQYITKCYGSLTTFNVLFKSKEDYFVGEKTK